MIGGHSGNYQPAVDQVLAKYQLGCQSSINQDVDHGYQSRVSINTQP